MHLWHGILTGGRLSTVDLLIKVAVLLKRRIIVSIYKGADLS